MYLWGFSIPFFCIQKPSLNTIHTYLLTYLFNLFQMSPESRYSSGYPPAPASNDPYSQHPSDHESVLSSGGGSNPAPVMMSNCKRGGCPNPVRMMSSPGGRPMPEYCSNDCLVEENNKQMTNNPYANATTNWPPASGPNPASTQQPEGPPQTQQGSSPLSNPATTADDK